MDTWNGTDNPNNQLAAIIGGVVGGSTIMLIAGVLTFAFFCGVLIWRCKDKSNSNYSGVHEETSHNEDEFCGITTANFTELSGERNQDSISQQLQRQNQKAVLPDNTFPGISHFSRENVVLLERLGMTEYGAVFTAEACNWASSGRQLTVTAKTLNIEADQMMKAAYQKEALELAKLNHRNVMGLLAVCTDQAPECMLLDAGKSRDLLTYIHQKKRQSFGFAEINLEQMQQIDDNLEFLHMADGICLGMCYLASLGIVHTDLSLRNCILGFDGVVKVAGYGLAEQWYPDAYFALGDKTYPIRWMSPESIKTLSFTTSSDVWAFGIVVWELMTYGRLPYGELSNEEAVELISTQGVFPARPMTCQEAVYSVMMACWKQESSERQSFEQLHHQLQDLIVETQLEY